MEAKTSFMGQAIYYLLPIRRRIIKRNIERVYDGISPRDKTKLCKAFYGHMWRFVKELSCNTFLPWTRSRQLARIDNIYAVERALQEGKGALWLACHLGNWEVSLVKLMEKTPHFRGRVSIVRKRLRPTWLNEKIQKRFRDAGISILEADPGALRKILKSLKKNEVVIFVMDQHSSPPLGIETEFFGHPASISRGLARIALRTGAPVLPAITWRDPDGTQVCHFGEAVPTSQASDQEEALRATTQAYNTVMESYIRQHPEQWFCLAHRLWKIPS